MLAALQQGQHQLLRAWDRHCPLGLWEMVTQHCWALLPKPHPGENLRDPTQPSPCSMLSGLPQKEDSKILERGTACSAEEYTHRGADNNHPGQGAGPDKEGSRSVFEAPAGRVLLKLLPQAGGISSPLGPWQEAAAGFPFSPSEGSTLTPHACKGRAAMTFIFISSRTGALTGTEHQATNLFPVLSAGEGLKSSGPFVQHEKCSPPLKHARADGRPLRSPSHPSCHLNTFLCFVHVHPE